MFRALFAPIHRSTTAAYSHRCEYGFGMLVHSSRYYLGHPHTFSTVSFRQTEIDRAELSINVSLTDIYNVTYRVRLLLFLLFMTSDIVYRPVSKNVLISLVQNNMRNEVSSKECMY
jgi:hypothetical protein